MKNTTFGEFHVQESGENLNTTSMISGESVTNDIIEVLQENGQQAQRSRVIHRLESYFTVDVIEKGIDVLLDKQYVEVNDDDLSITNDEHSRAQQTLDEMREGLRGQLSVTPNI